MSYETMSYETMSYKKEYDMPTPVATIANLTATGDVIIGPGGITTMVKGLPWVCIKEHVWVM
jgi:hypothetical protein